MSRQPELLLHFLRAAEMYPAKILQKFIKKQHINVSIMIIITVILIQTKSKSAVHAKAKRVPNFHYYHHRHHCCEHALGWSIAVLTNCLQHPQPRTSRRVKITDIIIRAHSFPGKIMLNSVGQFAKFRGLPRQNRPNSTPHHGLPFVSKLSF